MKRLLLLFILTPFALFGQVRQKAIADSIKAAATNLQRVSSLIVTNPGNKVERVDVSDSGGYVTLVVRVRVTEACIIPILSTYPIVKIKVNSTVPDKLKTVTTPPVPRPVFEIDTILALPLLASIQVIVKAIVTNRAEIAIVPDLPDFETDIIDALSPSAVPYLSVVQQRPVKMDTFLVPGFEETRMEVAEMHLSDDGYDLLEKLEGFSPALYSLKDGGFTIGFGFFVPYGEGNKWSKGVTWEEAERILREKVPAYEDQVKKYINVALTQKEFDALTMLAYNLGGFSKATSIVNDINTGADFEKLQKDWMRFIHSKAPGVMKGLMNRRSDEIQVRNESDYQPERKIQILKK